MKIVFVAAGLAAAFGTLVLAQAPAKQAPRPQFRAGVDLVRLEVTVLDKRTRKPMRGLTAADFVVKVNGEPQSIEVADEVEIAARHAGLTALPAAFLEAAHDVTTNALTSPRLFVIVMDDAMSARDLFHRKKGRDIANAVVDGLGPNDLAAVVFAQDNRHAQEFTSDRAALRKAISTFEPRPLHPLMAGLMSVSVLERANAFLRKMPGYRRAIVWVTMGPGTEPDLDEESLLQWLPEPTNIPNVTAGEAAEALGRAATRASAAAGAVPIYAYSTLGIPPVTAAETKGGKMPPLFGNAVLERMTSTTGGRHFYNTNAPERSVPAMFEELSSYYAIAYRSSFPMDGRNRWLEVQVKRPDVLITPPPSSFATPMEGGNVRRPARSSSRSPLLDALSGPLPHGDIRLALSQAAFAEAGGKEHTVAATVGVPVAAGAGRQFGFDLKVFDSDGRQTLVKREQTITVAPNTTARMSEIVVPFTLPPGKYLLRTSVADIPDGATGSVFMSLEVPDFERERLSISGVAIGRAEGPPIAGRELLEGVLPFAPTVLREFAARDHVGALVRIHQKKGEAVDVVFAATILDATGRTVASESRAIPAVSFADARGVEHRYNLPLAALPAGEYLLQFEATGGKAQATRQVRFSIR
jgi:VWFA-related protein